MIEFVDEYGRKQRYQMSDEDGDVAYTQAEVIELGVDRGIPDLDQIDWAQAVTDIHNKLFDMHMFTMDDVTVREGMLSAAILSILKGKIANLYLEGVN